MRRLVHVLERYSSEALIIELYPKDSGSRRVVYFDVPHRSDCCTHINEHDFLTLDGTRRSLPDTMASPIPLDLGLLAPHDLLRSSAYSLSTEAMQILLRKDLTYENIAPDMRAELNMIGAKQLGEQTGKLTSFLLGSVLVPRKSD